MEIAELVKDSTIKESMELTTIEAKTLPEAWFLCLKACLEYGYEYRIERGSFEGQRRKEFDFITIKVQFPGIRPLVPETPPGVPPPSTMDYVEQYLPYIMTDQPQPNEEYTYGQYIVPQLEEVIKMCKLSPNTNQATITIGDKTSINLKNPPCLRLIDVRIRYGAVHFIVYFRSWDLWAGFPSNLAAIQILKEYIASESGLQDGELIACSKGLHLYDYQWDLARLVTRRKNV